MYSSGIRGVRYVCKHCCDIDLCEDHYEQREMGKLNLTRCERDHEYLAVAADETYQRLEGQYLGEWSLDLKRRLGTAGVKDVARTHFGNEKDGGLALVFL